LPFHGLFPLLIAPGHGMTHARPGAAAGRFFIL